MRRAVAGPAILGAVLLGAAVWYALFIARTAFVLDGRTSFTLFDDAMISMRYARNLADGSGLLWNPGEPPVEGTSNFLWTLVMAVPHAAGVPEHLTSLWISALGAVLLLVRAGILWRIARALAPESAAAAPCTAVLAAFSYSTTFWTLRGMEVGFLALVVDASVLAVVSAGTVTSVRRRVALASLLAAGVLTRTDAIVPLGVVAAWAAFTAPRDSRKQTLAWVGAALLVPLAAHTAFRVAYYGDPLPNTYYLKMTGASVPERVGRGAAMAGTLVASHLWMLLPVAAAGAAVAGRRAAALLLCAVTASTFAYSVWVGGDAWEQFGFSNRYIATGLGAMQVLAGIAVARVASAASRRVSPRAFGLVLLGLCSCGAAVAAAVLLARRSDTGATVFELWSPRRFGVAVALAAGAAGGVAAAFRIARRPAGGPAGRETGRWDLRDAVIGITCGALVWAATDLGAFRTWNRRNAEKIRADAMMARLGRLVREGTDADARVAFVWAGTAPYYSGRAAVDLLGKSDPAVARMHPVAPFFPGHDKWDLARSLGELRPDVVVELWNPTPDELARTVAWGYRELPNGIRVLEGSQHVRADVLSRPWRVATFVRDGE